MADREKVISDLKEQIAWIRDNDFHKFPGWGHAVLAMRDALALLKEQEAVKPVVDIDTWTCGNCGHTLEHQKLLGDNVLFHEQYDYCPMCGKKVKWE